MRLQATRKLALRIAGRAPGLNARQKIWDVQEMLNACVPDSFHFLAI